MMNTAIVIENVFAWRCPNCNGANISPGIPVEFDAEDKAEMEERYDVPREEWTPDKFVTYPDEADCELCGLTVELQDDGKDRVMLQ